MTEILRKPAVFTVDDPRFSTAQVVGPSMLSLDGAAHSAHRGPFESPFGLAETRRPRLRHPRNHHPTSGTPRNHRSPLWSPG